MISFPVANSADMISVSVLAFRGFRESNRVTESTETPPDGDLFGRDIGDLARSTMH